MLTKFVKMKAILVHLHRRIYKSSFKHDVGNNEEICQIEGHSDASSKMYFPKFSSTMVKLVFNEICQNEGHSSASSKVNLQNFL